MIVDSDETGVLHADKTYDRRSPSTERMFSRKYLIIQSLAQYRLDQSLLLRTPVVFRQRVFFERWSV